MLINKTDYELINTFKLTAFNILKYRYVLVGANVIAVWDHEFLIIITMLKHIFNNQNRKHYNQHTFANEK